MWLKKPIQQKKINKDLCSFQIYQEKRNREVSWWGARGICARVHVNEKDMEVVALLLNGKWDTVVNLTFALVNCKEWDVDRTTVQREILR